MTTHFMPKIQDPPNERHSHLRFKRAKCTNTYLIEQKTLSILPIRHDSLFHLGASREVVAPDLMG